MATSKSDLFSEPQVSLANWAKALSHPARVAIIELLIQQNACINIDLVHELGLAQSTISQHLKELKDIGLIKGTVEGRKMNYCLEPSRWNELRSVMSSFLDKSLECNMSQRTC